MVSIRKKQAEESKNGKVIVVVFCLLFAAAGSFFFYMMTLQPLFCVFTARNWGQVPCKIVSAAVDSCSDSDGVTYRIDILYEYEYSGKKYESNRYDFMDMYSSGYEAKAKVVHSYEKNGNPICYINPGNPSEAVLNKGLHPGFLWALFPIPFMLIGFGGMYFVLTRYGQSGSKIQEHTKKKKSSNIYGQDWLNINGDSEPVTVKTISYLSLFIRSILIAAFWNGILTIFLIQAIHGVRSGDIIFGWAILLFLVPFELIGALLLVVVLHSFLNLFNPRVDILLSSRAIPAGGSALLSWQFIGRTSRIRKLIIILKAKEIACSTHGGDSSTSFNTSFEKEVYSSDDAFAISSGQTFLAIPSYVMPTFKSENNKIEWEVTLCGEIRFFPDVKQCFNVTVIPMERNS